MIPTGVAVYVALEPVDMRYSFERLSGFVTERIGYEARSGNPLNHIHQPITIALEQEPKSIAVQTSTAIPILAPAADLPQVIEPIQVGKELSVSKPVQIEEELAVSEPKEINLELQVVEEEQIRERAKVQQSIRKITQTKKRDRGGR